ncbi:MAG: hypothetical protein MJZ37_01155 [Bacilli bacterium]|nr:hypothetical protein [Bacilli bacterium]
MGKRCLINVDGGLGKNVMLTSLMPILAKKYEEIYVISPYSDVFKSCSYVTESFEPGPQCATLYQELVLDPDTDILWKEPYSNSRFIKKSCHLFDAWTEEFGIEKSEIDWAAKTPVLDRIREEFPQIGTLADQKISELGKFIMVQFCGGQSPLNPMVDQNGNAIPYNDRQEFIKRNFYQGQQLIDALKSEYPDATIVHYALPNEPSYEGAIKLNIPYIAYRLLAEHAFKVVCTDSSLQHLSTGACKDVTVIWGETRPEHFGYTCNKNIAAKHVLNSQPYFKPMGMSPSIVKMPSVNEVVELVKMDPEEINSEDKKAA